VFVAGGFAFLAFAIPAAHKKTRRERSRRVLWFVAGQQA
jgi:hypothetical protein